jgi:periplasmic protein TonB
VTGNVACEGRHCPERGKASSISLASCLADSASRGRVTEMVSVASPRGPELSPPVSRQLEPILPTLFGEGCGLYRTRRITFVFSFVGHAAVIAILLTSAQYVVSHRREIRRQVIDVVTDISPYVLPFSRSQAGGGGGGGDRDKLAASKGALPRLAREQITPPAVVVRNEDPKLPVEPTVVVPPALQLPHTGVLGDPLSAVLAPPSNGTGFGGGIGSGSGGGVGSGTGPGVGSGRGGGIGGGVYRVGGGVSAPRPIYSPDPEYSEEARKAKYQGMVVLWVVVGPDGTTRDIRIQHSLGMGLDEKAIASVRTWKFEPARKNGTAVAVQVSIEITFRLY